MNNYKLTDNHFNQLSYFDRDLYDNLYYNLNDDILIERFDKELVIKVLDYYKDYNDSFITKENYKTTFEIFFHFGSELGMLFCYHNGIVIKELQKLKKLKSIINNKNIYDNYISIVNFNTKIYNYENKKKYQKYFDWYFELLQFDLNILDYEQYYIKETIINNLNDLQLLKKNTNNSIFRININCNCEIDKNNLPKDLTHLTFSSKFNKIIKENVLPNNLTNLKFGELFNQKINKCIIPQGLKYLFFSFRFNQEIKKNVLPEGLIQLKFIWGSNFNQEIKENVLPKSLKYLIFGNIFNKKIKENVLPNGLEHLIFGDDFNQEIEEDVLPKSLKLLKFGSYYNQEIKENVLPEGLTHLEFGENFNQKIEKNIFPKSLKYLTFDPNIVNYIENIFEIIPPSIEIIFKQEPLI